MSSQQIMVVLIVLIVMAASVIKARYRVGRNEGDERLALPDAGEARRQREELRALKDRVAVLERIATDKNNLLEQEFERLRDR